MDRKNLNDKICINDKIKTAVLNLRTEEGSKRNSVNQCYFHSQIFSVKFPSVSTSVSNNPTRLLRNASLPVDDVLKKPDPRHLTPEGVTLPIPSPVETTISDSPAIITPFAFP